MLLKNINIKVHNNTILAAILYACEIWFLTLREEHRLKVSRNRALWITFGPKCKKVIGVWEKEHNKAFHNLYSLHITMTKSQGVRLVVHDIQVGDKEKCILSFGEKGKLEVNRPLQSPVHGLKYSIGYDRNKMGQYELN